MTEERINEFEEADILFVRDLQKAIRRASAKGKHKKGQDYDRRKNE